MYNLIRMKYRMKKIPAQQVWDYADEGVITEAQAILICGPRPTE